MTNNQHANDARPNLSWLAATGPLALCLVIGGVLAQQSPSGAAGRAGEAVVGEAVDGVTALPSHRGQAVALGQGFATRAFSGIAASAPEWSAANGVTPSLSFSHNLSRIFAPALYDEHPEFFPLVGGQRYRPGKGPAYWNPDLGRADVAAFAADAARAYFADHPERQSFSVGVNDALLFGESDETLRAIARDGRWKMGDRRSNDTGASPLIRPPSSGQKLEPGVHEARPYDPISGESSAGACAWFRERPDYSNLVFTFTNRVAERVAATHPDKYVGALAYYWAENAPDFPLHPNVVPFLTADRSQGYDRLFQEEEALLQRRWAARAGATPSADGGRSTVDDSSEKIEKTRNSKLGTLNRAQPPRLGLYDYLYGQGFLIPRIHTRLLAENLRQAHRIGFTDYYAEMSPNWGLDGPQPWLVARLLQDPEQSPEVLLDEYYLANFGPAAVPIRRFFERCERQWMVQPGTSYWLKHFRNESQAKLFPSSVCRELRALLTDAERATDSAVALRRSELEDEGSGRPGGAVADREAVRKQVRLVSDAFGVTERFVAMQEARDQLNRLCLGEGRARPLGAPGQSREVEGNTGEPGGPARLGSCDALLDAVVGFVKARDELVDYTNRLQETSPLAIAAFQWEDYLRHDPVTPALVSLRAGAKAEGKMDRADTTIARAGSPELSEAWALCAEADRLRGISLVRNRGLAGAVQPAREIAGLDYGVALPEGWESSVEPAQFQRATIGDRDSENAGIRSGSNSDLRTPNSGNSLAAARVLRLTGNKETSIFQWNTPKPERVHVASVTVRGHVSPGTVVSLTFGFLDGQQQRLELKTLRLPEGDWPEWVTLRLVERSPAGAKWVGIGVRIQNQVAGDWAEVKEFELTAH